MDLHHPYLHHFSCMDASVCELPEHCLLCVTFAITDTIFHPVSLMSISHRCSIFRHHLPTIIISWLDLLTVLALDNLCLPVPGDWPVICFPLLGLSSCHVAAFDNVPGSPLSTGSSGSPSPPMTDGLWDSALQLISQTYSLNTSY